MTRASHLLLLAGSGEARKIASALAKMPVRATVSVFEPDHWSGPLPLPTRSGGFGGDHAFAAYLDAQQVTAVLDATHPFAARISARSWAICQEKGLPYLHLERLPWAVNAGDAWTEVDKAEEAAALTMPKSRVFVTTGRETLDAFAEYTDRQFIFRRLAVDGPVSDMSNVTYLYGNGPFSAMEEQATFESLNIDMLICKNTGGAVSHTKLEAARALNLPVILLRRPAPTGAPLVRDVSDALDWVRDTCL